MWKTIALVLIASLEGFSQDSPAALQQTINSKFRLTTLSSDNTEIVTQGSTLVLLQPALVMYNAGLSFPALSTYKNGRISLGLIRAMRLSTPDDANATDSSFHVFKSGDKLLVTAIAISKNAVTFRLYSDLIDGIRYDTDLKFQFEKNSLTANTVLRTIAEVLSIPDEASASDPTTFAVYHRFMAPEDVLTLKTDGTLSLAQAGKNDQGTYKTDGNKLTLQIGPQTSTVTLDGNLLIDAQGSKWIKQWDPSTRVAEAPANPQAQEAPPAPIAPPPSPAAEPIVITLGQTIQQVTGAFGLPEKIVKLPKKEIYIYKDMKVTFVDGKATDIQ